MCARAADGDLAVGRILALSLNPSAAIWAAKKGMLAVLFTVNGGGRADVAALRRERSCIQGSYGLRNACGIDKHHCMRLTCAMHGCARVGVREKRSTSLSRVSYRDLSSSLTRVTWLPAFFCT